MSRIRSSADGASADAKGQFVKTITVPDSFPHGTFTLEAHGAAGRLTASEFDKGFSDEDLDERDHEVDHPRLSAEVAITLIRLADSVVLFIEETRA